MHPSLSKQMLASVRRRLVGRLAPGLGSSARAFAGAVNADAASPAQRKVKREAMRERAGGG